MSELHALDIEGARSLIRRRELTSVSLTSSLLERIAASEPLLNASIEVLHDEALAAAEQADSRLAEGQAVGPLHGIPLGVKDNIAVRGHPTTAGSLILADAVASNDAVVTDRLRKAGAILISRLNMDEFAAGATTSNPHYGQTRNAWNPACIPGGSSGARL